MQHGASMFSFSKKNSKYFFHNNDLIFPDIYINQFPKYMITDGRKGQLILKRPGILVRKLKRTFTNNIFLSMRLASVQHLDRASQYLVDIEIDRFPFFELIYYRAIRTKFRQKILSDLLCASKDARQYMYKIKQGNLVYGSLTVDVNS